MAQVEIEPRAGYAILRLTGDDGLHRLELATLKTLRQYIEKWRQTSEFRALVVTGSPENSFAVGANIRELQMISPQNAPEYAAVGQGLFRLMQRAPQLFIAAIDGYCLGGGLDFALACDVRYATERSQFAHPGARLGIITGFGGTVRLPQTVGTGAAYKLLLSGEVCSGSEAQRIGLVERIFPPEHILEKACELAEQTVTSPSGLMALIKELAYTTVRLPVSQAEVFERRAWQVWASDLNSKK